MLFWDTRIADARVAQRIELLDEAKAAVYVVGCVTHAKDVLVRARTGSATGEFLLTERLLDHFWNNYPAVLKLSEIEPIANEAADSMPGEEGGSSGWEDSLLEAAAYSLSYVFSIAKGSRSTQDARGTAIGSLDRAYWSVFSFNHERDCIHPSEEEIQQVEMSSPICRAEIEFQLSFLAILEGLPTPPPSYAAILTQFGIDH